MRKCKAGVTGFNDSNGNFHNLGTYALNIFELLRKSDFFKSYAPMYDQFRITSIKVKVTPVTWKAYNQFNIPTLETLLGSTNRDVPNGEPVYPGDQITADNNNNVTAQHQTKYIYPQAMTVVTAWDRTGLDSTQILYNKGSAEDHHDDKRYITIGDNITTYSSAKSSQLIAGNTFNCTRYLYPSSQQEKSLYFSTSCLHLQQVYDDTDDAYYEILYDDEDTKNWNSSEICNLESNPNCPFKPTFLLGIMSIDKPRIKTLQQGEQAVTYETTDTVNQINPVTFNLEFDIGVTFRGLRKSQVV